jgi:hypothetical protein
MQMNADNSLVFNLRSSAFIGGWDFFTASQGAGFGPNPQSGYAVDRPIANRKATQEPCDWPVEPLIDGPNPWTASRIECRRRQCTRPAKEWLVDKHPPVVVSRC